MPLDQKRETTHGRSPSGGGVAPTGVVLALTLALAGCLVEFPARTADGGRSRSADGASDGPDVSPGATGGREVALPDAGPRFDTGAAGGAPAPAPDAARAPDAGAANPACDQVCAACDPAGEIFTRATDERCEIGRDCRDRDAATVRVDEATGHTLCEVRTGAPTGACVRPGECADGDAACAIGDPEVVASVGECARIEDCRPGSAPAVVALPAGAPCRAHGPRSFCSGGGDCLAAVACRELVINWPYTNCGRVDGRVPVCRFRLHDVDGYAGPRTCAELCADFDLVCAGAWAEGGALCRPERDRPRACDLERSPAICDCEPSGVVR